MTNDPRLTVVYVPNRRWALSSCTCAASPSPSSSSGVCTRRAFTVDEGTPESPRRVSNDDGRPRVMPNDRKSQSERDWAYAKRALARGDDPEKVIRTIADYRSEDKADPNYYARRTVTQAQARLALEHSEHGSPAGPKAPGLDPEH